MTIKITIPNTSSDTLTFGSNNTPTAAQIAGIDSGSSNGQLAIYTTASGTSTERVRVDSSGNVGIGTASPALAAGYTAVAAYNATNGAVFRALSPDLGADGRLQVTNSIVSVGSFSNVPLLLYTNGIERARIDSSGNLLVGTASVISVGKISTAFDGSVAYGASFKTTYGSAGSTFAAFVNSGGTVQGSIYANATNTVQYLTSSDYRLKENIAPLTGALAKVSQLKPVTYNWKSDGSSGQGFIAHELAEVAPECVGGEKDAVDADNNPVYQGIDTSFLVATLTAAIQEQQSLIKALTARIEALEKK